MERSSLENYLQGLTGELGIDHASFPITPETFLEKTSSFGRRCVINNQAVLSSSVEASTAI